MNINKIDEEINKISQQVGIIANIIPSNLYTEKKKFFNSNDYNPVFEYKRLNIDFIELKKRMSNMKCEECDEEVIGKLLKEKIKKFNEKIIMLENIGKPDFSLLCEKYFGKPNKELVEKARQEVKNIKPNIKKNMLDTKEVIKRIQKTIQEYKLGWKIVIKEQMIPRISVNRDEKSVFIRKNAKFSEQMLRGTIAHEIETHVFRAENGALQPYKIFFTGLPDYDITEEGLAIINAETVCPVKKLSNQSALRLLGIECALNGSFRDVFNMVLETGFAKNIAWSVALRSKRGLILTEKQGAFTKDYLYFKGKELVKEYIKNKGDIVKLYYGKIGIEHVKLLDKIKGLKKPKFVPKFINKL